MQLAGRADCSILVLDADALALSAHKMGGPKGAGALATARPALSLGEPLIRGGGQERGARGGTENVAAVAGFGAAASACRAEAAEPERLTSLRRRLERVVREAASDAVVFGAAAPRLPNTLCFAVPGVEAATLIIALDLAGVAVSSGSACSSGKVTPSHVLAAMGVKPELARGAIRLSLGFGSTDDDVERFAEAFSGALRRMRRSARSTASEAR